MARRPPSRRYAPVVFRCSAYGARDLVLSVQDVQLLGVAVRLLLGGMRADEHGDLSRCDPQVVCAVERRLSELERRLRSLEFLESSEVLS